MLGKLMKYEFKATSRMLLPINGAMLLFALINRLFMELNFFQTGNMEMKRCTGCSLPRQAVSICVMRICCMVRQVRENVRLQKGWLRPFSVREKSAPAEPARLA